VEGFFSMLEFENRGKLDELNLPRPPKQEFSIRAKNQ
jgi:hypothetical protein